MDTSRVLTQLRFKNWRSLRDVTIDNLTPITVFIGANSSGKSNILDALRFLRYSIAERNIFGAVFSWGGRDKIKSIGTDANDPIEFELTLTLDDVSVTDHITLQFDGSDVLFGRKMFEGKAEIPVGKTEPVAKRLNDFKRERMQLLQANFLPPLTLRSDSLLPEDLDPFLIDPLARNVPAMLNFMQQTHAPIYHTLQADLGRLLSHVDALEINTDNREIQLRIYEKTHQGLEAPTVSTGTQRIIAMLTAHYALDMRSPKLPGLVVIEEPDTAVHPLLLKNLVEMLRVYVDRSEPRQFILTTHNPAFLSYFEPEEVRVVERDSETGETWVDPIPDYLRETWLHKHGLGDAWLSNLIGGIPEI
ncbi:MAG: AAA family ATPase [Aggregatilineales bacterium]